MSGIYYKDKLRANVTIPNPQDAATADLGKVKIDGTTYDVKDADAIHNADVGAAGGVAELDANGFVPQAQLPSYVDDVLEYASVSAFPATGESGKIYVALDTNKTYRWSGSAYVEISESLALGETNSTAYRGDRGKTAYDHSQTTSGNPHNVSKTDVGLGNVPNVATDDQTPTVTEASTRANLAVGDSLKTIIGKIKKFFADLKTVAFTGSYTDLSDKPTIPTVNNGTLTIQKNGTNVTTFTANQSSNATANITVPTGDLASINKDGTSSTKYLRGDGTWQNFPSIPAAQVQSDWTQTTTTAVDYIKNKPNLATVATSGSYNDLSNKPTIPSYSVVSTSANGLAPKVTDTSKFLKGDGTWAKPTDTTYSVVSTSANGLAPKVTDTSKFLKGDGTWATPTDTNTTYTLSADTTNNKIKLTPSSGSAQSITVPYATSAGSATDDTKLPLAGGTMTGAITMPNTTATVIAAGANEKGVIGSSTKYFYESFIKYMNGKDVNLGKAYSSNGTVLFYNSNNGYWSYITGENISGSNKTLYLPNENGTLATREYISSILWPSSVKVKGLYCGRTYMSSNKLVAEFIFPLIHGKTPSSASLSNYATGVSVYGISGYVGLDNKITSVTYPYITETCVLVRMFTSLTNNIGNFTPAYVTVNGDNTTLSLTYS